MSILGTALHLTVDGAERASAWYADAFGAIENGRIALPGGRLIDVELQIGDLTLVLADEFPEMESFGPAHLGGTYGAIYLRVDDVDATWRRAVDAGAQVVRPLADAFWGERDGQLLDPFGLRWGLTQRIAELPHEEVQRLATEAFSGGGGLHG